MYFLNINICDNIILVFYSSYSINVNPMKNTKTGENATKLSNIKHLMNFELTYSNHSNTFNYVDYLL